MRDKELYAEILGIGKPWYVEDVELRLESVEVIIKVAMSGKEELKCPECGEES